MEYKECTIKGFEGLYHIYEDGVIYSVRKRRALSDRFNSTGKYGYLYVTLTGHDKQLLTTAVHRIVAHHWLYPQPAPHIALGRYEVNHIDMDKTNNHYTNLEWITHSENMRKAMEMKSWKAGRNPGFKHSEETKHKQSLKKMKKVLLFNDNQSIIYDSVEEFCKEQNTYRKKFNRIVNSHKTINGFKVRYL